MAIDAFRRKMIKQYLYYDVQYFFSRHPEYQIQPQELVLVMQMIFSHILERPEKTHSTHIID